MQASDRDNEQKENMSEVVYFLASSRLWSSDLYERTYASLTQSYTGDGDEVLAARDLMGMPLATTVLIVMLDEQNCLDWGAWEVIEHVKHEQGRKKRALRAFRALRAILVVKLYPDDNLTLTSIDRYHVEIDDSNFHQRAKLSR